MLSEFMAKLQEQLERSLKDAFPGYKNTLPPIELEIPSEHQHGEFSSNIALKSSKLFKKPPMVLAGEFLPIIENALNDNGLKEQIASVSIKKPGFINFYLTPKVLYGILEQIFTENKKFGRLALGKHTKVQIEFVSANPTGPLSVAHARQAAVGDALANILNFIGFECAKEYYVNDGGIQIKKLGESIKCRAVEVFGGTAQIPEDGYQGGYVKDMAEIFLAENKITTLKELDAIEQHRFSEFGVRYLMEVIRKDLEDFNVHFDEWSYESRIATKANIEGVLDYLGEKGFLYEKDGALWFKSTDFGDDKDRVVEKSDGTYTYLTPDIAYHRNKYERKFEKVINIWGPDHHGYIPRLKAAVEALGRDRESLEVLIVQLATIYREGRPISMSTRRGEFISLREVMDEVGVDAARFFFLMRHINVHLDFDLELAKKETSENPVYYIQYAHARVHSVNDKAREAKIQMKKAGFQLLNTQEELELIKKLGSFSDILLLCYKELDPYALASYLQDVATAFHKFYDCHRILDPERYDLSAERLALTNAAGIVLANGLRLLGLSTPEKM